MKGECELFLAILANLQMDRKLQLQKNQCMLHSVPVPFPRLEIQGMPLW